MTPEYSLRLISESDAAEVLEIYRPFVEDTIISFEYDVPSVEDYLHRIRTIIADYPWLLCTHGDRIAGFAYASRHRQRTAYQWSAESTVYIRPEFHRRGIARVLYESLFALMKHQGYCNVYAGVSLPNEKSTAFHRALGFYEVGIYRKSGYKFGAWHDTQWFQLHLAQHVTHPPVPKAMRDIVSGRDFQRIMEEGNERLKGFTQRHQGTKE